MPQPKTVGRFSFRIVPRFKLRADVGTADAGYPGISLKSSNFPVLKFVKKDGFPVQRKTEMKRIVLPQRGGGGARNEKR